ncbi:Rossmann-like and DUF2520 domain-containing protein [Pedobacter boryungensis]|uniref:DUF2520 domain-containing protein n=1 Tax=Pedobacter boryungensis TaxID=869962 RepID=A0ABX2D8B8_9SPHI|nr:Rossmann-like and DUF2520 domain-containing protein [Pedobacter boryungensis]NQX30303.1 DUF2520 domain-containing protein [Pedobacter boryungensis]
MKVVIIGAGNVATHLAKALHLANVQIVQVWSYHYTNAKLLADQVEATAIESLTSIDEHADLCLISVKDDAIEEIAQQLTHFKGVIAHTSGSVHLNILANSKKYGVFYPLQTFSKDKELSFTTIPLCLEANDNATLQFLKKLASQLSSRVVEIDSNKRKILHLAAVFACNFTNHFYALAEEVLEAHQLEFDILRPLITETAAKVQQALPLTVQTGPAVRNDEQTLKKHEELLLQQPQLLEIYKIVSESIKKTR